MNPWTLLINALNYHPKRDPFLSLICTIQSSFCYIIPLVCCPLCVYVHSCASSRVSGAVTNPISPCRWWWPCLLTSIISHSLLPRAYQLRQFWIRWRWGACLSSFHYKSSFKISLTHQIYLMQILMNLTFEEQLALYTKLRQVILDREVWSCRY